ISIANITPQTPPSYMIVFYLILRTPLTSSPYPYTTLFRSNTFYMVLYKTPIVMSVALGIAILLNMDLPGEKLFRTLIYFPSVLADRKSTRLDSSHVKMSYAVVCLKKKNSVLYKELWPPSTD